MDRLAKFAVGTMGVVLVTLVLAAGMGAEKVADLTPVPGDDVGNYERCVEWLRTSEDDRESVCDALRTLADQQRGAILAHDEKKEPEYVFRFDDPNLTVNYTWDHLVRIAGDQNTPDLHLWVDGHRWKYSFELPDGPDAGQFIRACPPCDCGELGDPGGEG